MKLLFPSRVVFFWRRRYCPRITHFLVKYSHDVDPILSPCKLVPMNCMPWLKSLLKAFSFHLLWCMDPCRYKPWQDGSALPGVGL